MDNELPSFFHNVSLCIDEVLDVLGYSQSDRERKIKCSIVSEVLENMFSSIVTRYILGSTSDGSTMHALHSDTDTLYQMNKYNAVTDVSECLRRKVNLLMVQADDTHPGYAKLQYVDFTRPNYSVPVWKCFLTESVLDGVQMFPNTLLKLNTERLGLETNGPATTEIFQGTGASVDRVLAIRCYRWPAEGECFFTRRRYHGWPTAEQLHHIRTYGCFLVPVGHPSSSEPHLEWRLSFSIGERDLTRSLNDTMMKVFLLLKIIKKTFIKPVIGDNFCSYHCKVCIFWVRERTCQEIWKRENILLCLSLCLEQLLVWAKSGYCPDFFNENNNIYDRKITGNVRLHLVCILETMLCNKFEYLRCIQIGNIGSLLSFRITFGYLPIHCSNKDAFMEFADDYSNVYSSYISLHTHMQILQQKGWISIYGTIKAVSSAVRNAPPIVTDALSCALPAMYANLTYQLASLFIAEKHVMNAEIRSQTLNMMSKCVARGIDCDSVSCRLKMAGFFYQLDLFDFTEVCLQLVLDRVGDYLLNLPLFRKLGESTVVGSAPAEKIFGKKPDLKTFFRDHVALSVGYNLSDIPITPAPVRLELFRSLWTLPESIVHSNRKVNLYRAQVDHPIFTHLLLYLCHDRKENKTSKHMDIINLLHVIKTDPNKEKRETSFNLLGYCLMKEGMFVEACACFKKSWRILPHVNACKFWMAVLLQKAYNMSRHCQGIT